MLPAAVPIGHTNEYSFDLNDCVISGPYTHWSTISVKIEQKNQNKPRFKIDYANDLFGPELNIKFYDSSTSPKELYYIHVCNSYIYLQYCDTNKRMHRHV